MRRRRTQESFQGCIYYHLTHRQESSNCLSKIIWLVISEGGSRPSRPIAVLFLISVGLLFAKTFNQLFPQMDMRNESNVFRRGSICLVSVKVDQKQRPGPVAFMSDERRSICLPRGRVFACRRSKVRQIDAERWMERRPMRSDVIQLCRRHRLQLIKDCGVRLNPIKYDPLITPKAPCSKSIQNPSTSSAGHQLLHLHIYLYTHTRCIYIYI